jgi:glycosyltransferase involved in cell wall biosynthesis
MNIAYVHSGVLPSSSPSETFVLYNALGLSKHFNKVYLFLTKKIKTNSNDIVKLRFNLDVPDNLIIKTHYSIFQKYSNNFLYKHYYNDLKSLCEKKEIDAIITRRNTFLPFLVKLKKKYNIPVIFESHDFYADLSMRNDLKKNKWKKEERLEKKYIPKLSAVFCLQNTQMELYKKVFPETKFFLVRTGMNKPESIRERRKKYITYIGSFDKLKGINTLLEATKKIEYGITTLIIGAKTRQEIDMLDDARINMSLFDKVIVEGWLPKEKLKKYLEKTIIGIVPLEDTFFNKYLTSPLKIFDYYSYNIPIIASDIPSCRELILEKETGLFFKPGNPDDLAEKINFLLNNQNMIKTMSENINNFSQQFLWENRAKLILDIIQKLKK